MEFESRLLLPAPSQLNKVESPFETPQPRTGLLLPLPPRWRAFFLWESIGVSHPASTTCCWVSAPATAVERWRLPSSTSLRLWMGRSTLDSAREEYWGPDHLCFNSWGSVSRPREASWEDLRLLPCPPPSTELGSWRSRWGVTLRETCLCPHPQLQSPGSKIFAWAGGGGSPPEVRTSIKHWPQKPLLQRRQDLIAFTCRTTCASEHYWKQ